MRALQERAYSLVLWIILKCQYTFWPIFEEKNHILRIVKLAISIK